MQTALAPFACDPAQTRGRLHPEPSAPSRSEFQRDRDRIIHCNAFRRLKYKTQVFVYHEGEHFRTRLTHSLEVSQVARAICRMIGLNEDLAEALALAHDLGHTPFGHAGEFALQDCMASFDGFDHNAQSLRIVTKLERRYAEFDGLNLTWETLEGLVKHNGPLTGQSDSKALPRAIIEYSEKQDLELDTYASAEAQVAALSDDIAYNAHDIDDGLRAGLFEIEDLMDLPLVGPVFREVMDRYPDIDEHRLIYESFRRVITRMVDDLVATTTANIAAFKPETPADVRHLGRPLVAFSAEMVAHDKALKAFLFPNMYRHFRVNRMTSKVKRVVKDLFNLFVAEPNLLPPEWQRPCDGPHGRKTARQVADYIAGMTDRFAIDEHIRLFDVSVKP